jgi:hypothetical protein
MNKLQVLGVTGFVLAGGVLCVATSFAQTTISSATANITADQVVPSKSPMPDKLHVLAQVLGMSDTDLPNQLHSGKTPEQLVQAHGFTADSFEKKFQEVLKTDGYPVDNQTSYQPDPEKNPKFHAFSEILGMSIPQIEDALKSGKTLEQLVSEKRMDMATFQQRMKILMDSGKYSQVQ